VLDLADGHGLAFRGEGYAGRLATTAARSLRSPRRLSVSRRRALIVVPLDSAERFADSFLYRLDQTEALISRLPNAGCLVLEWMAPASGRDIWRDS
jgi:hypothetical protein